MKVKCQSEESAETVSRKCQPEVSPLVGPMFIFIIIFCYQLLYGSRATNVAT